MLGYNRPVTWNSRSRFLPSQDCVATEQFEQLGVKLRVQQNTLDNLDISPDVVEFRRSLFVWPQQLHCLPFCRLRKGHRHRFGSLSLHVKAKTLFPKVADWSSVKFRPLVSYKQHHWKQLFRITCQAIDFVQRSVAPGFSVLSADALHHKISAFNLQPYC